MPQQPIPPLFKYCSARNGIKILRDLQFKFTPPNEFNDPFDCTPRIAVSDEEILKFTKERLKYLYAFNGVFEGNLRPLHYRRWMGVRHPAVAKKVKETLPVLKHFDKALQNNLSAAFGLLCLSEKKDSLLMWAHYADKHGGLVIELD